MRGQARGNLVMERVVWIGPSPMSWRWRNLQVSIKASVFIATSLDGFIARADGDLDWLSGGESASTEQDVGYQEFMDSVDTIVIGRNTFEPVRNRPEARR